MTDSHPSRNLYGESKVKRFYSIIWVRAKDELTKPKCNKCRTTDSIGSLGESLNLMGQLCIPTLPFPQLDLHGLLFDGNLDIAWVHSTKDR